MPAAATSVAHDSVGAELESLIRKSADGDRTAFDRLYRLTSARVFGLVLRTVRDHAQAEEVTQEVYIEIWQKAACFDQSRGQVISWMFTMARRRAIDRVRASQASRDRDWRHGLRDWVAPYDSVADHAEAVLGGERVRRALGGLTPFQRQAIELSYFAELSHAELAVILEVSVNTAKSRVRDAISRLRVQLIEPAELI